MYGTSFHRPDDFEQIVDYAASCLANVEFNVLVFRGFSGALVGPTVALRLKKPWALIRKPGDTAHSHNRIEGAISGKYVILDDFVDTGATIRAIIEAVANPYGDVNEWFRPDPLPTPVPAECVGIVLYERSWVMRRAVEREYWQEKLGGLRVLSWPNQNMTQCAGVGKITFPKQNMFGGGDYTNLLDPPPMPSLTRNYEEVAF